MKKLLINLIITLVLLSGCSQPKTTESLKPYKISVNNKILSYYDTKENIPEEFLILDNTFENMSKQDECNSVIIDKDDKIRRISIIDNKITTYNGISVGDNISKIENSFSYESKFKNNYDVIFNDDLEENPLNQNKEETFRRGD